MKTKIKTLLAICILGFVGLINIQASTDNKKLVLAETNVAETELAASEILKAEELFIQSAEQITALEADAEIEKYASKQILLIDNTLEISDFLNSEESVTASGADLEIEKYANKQVSLLKSRSSK
jgi:hypothetical protein